MATTDSMSRAFASTRNVLANVTPDQLDAPTPCQSWQVRQLINHFVMAPRWGVSALRTGVVDIEEEDFCAGDFRAAYEETARMAAEAFAEEGAMDKTAKLPFGEVPGSFLLLMVTTDQFAHGWDLARATGQPTDLDPSLAEEILAEAAIPDEFRGPDGAAPFGPARQAPEGATAADRLAALLGRSV